IAIDGSANEFFLNEEDVLSAAIEGGSMIVGRERAEAEAFEPSAPVEAAEEDFAGEWRAFEIGVDDAFYDVALFGQSITATIEDTVITIAGYVFTGLSVQAEYVDGELRFTGADDEGGMFDGIAAQLLEDGNLCLKLSAGEMGAFTLIMNRVEENS
ncbi:MAG: hypothetical protein IJ769_10290, partial [Clostridia bacterium]|nr:hypothetical protein [Clostridia bacterium]